MSANAAAGDLREVLHARAKTQLALIPETAEQQDQAIENRGRGRPPGAVNRATRQLRDYILNNFTDPALGLAAMSLPSDPERAAVKAIALAKVLGCKAIDAVELMRKCSEALMPYVHSKQPLGVQVNGKIAVLNIGLGADPQARIGGDQLAQLFDDFSEG